MDGAGVWSAYQAGRIAEIRNYCETDVVNTYLIFLRFQLMRGALTDEQFRVESEVVRSTLKKIVRSSLERFFGQVASVNYYRQTIAR